MANAVKNQTVNEGKGGDKNFVVFFRNVVHKKPPYGNINLFSVVAGSR